MKFIFDLLWKLSGWEIIGNVPTTENKYIIIVAPHTSNMDFIIGVMARGIMGFKARYLGKKALFKAPHGWFFRLTGGFPVDRSKNNNVVDQMVEMFGSHDKFVFTLAPEGTRKNVKEWKTGFYYIADNAGVPIVRAVMNRRLKKLTFYEPFWTTGNIEIDLSQIKQVY